MTTTSPLPGIIQASSRDLTPRSPQAPGPLARWLARSVVFEINDTAGWIAIATSAIAATLSLGPLFFGAGLFGLFPYQYARVVIYAASFLSGGIIAAGFLSQARTARFAAVLTTTMIATFALADLLQIPGWAAYSIKVAYGIGLIGAVAVAALRAVRARLTSG